MRYLEHILMFFYSTKKKNSKSFNSFSFLNKFHAKDACGEHSLYGFKVILFPFKVFFKFSKLFVYGFYTVLAYFEDFKDRNILKIFETTKLQCYCEVMTLFKETLGFIHEALQISIVHENIKNLLF